MEYVKLLKRSLSKNEIDYCLVGEPSSSDEIGDVIRNGSVVQLQVI